MPLSPTSLAIRHIQLLSFYISCKHCHLLLSNPHRLESCGHVFCHQCAKRAQQTGQCLLQTCSTPVQSSQVTPSKQIMILVKHIQQLQQIANIRQPCQVRLRTKPPSTTSPTPHPTVPTLTQPPPIHTATSPQSQNHPTSQTPPLTAQQCPTHATLPNHPHQPHATFPLANVPPHNTLEIPDEPSVDTSQDSATSHPVRLSPFPFDIPDEPHIDTSQDTLSPNHRHSSQPLANGPRHQPAPNCHILSENDPAHHASFNHHVSTTDHAVSTCRVDGNQSSPRLAHLAQSSSEPPKINPAVSLRLRVRPPTPVYVALPVRNTKRQGGQNATLWRCGKSYPGRSLNDPGLRTVSHLHQQELGHRLRKRRRLQRKSRPFETPPVEPESRRGAFAPRLSCALPALETQHGQDFKGCPSAVPLRLRLREQSTNSRAPRTPLISNTSGDDHGIDTPPLLDTPEPRKMEFIRLGRCDQLKGGDCLEKRPCAPRACGRTGARCKPEVRRAESCDIGVIEDFQESSDITTQSPSVSDTVVALGRPDVSARLSTVARNPSAAGETNVQHKFSKERFAVCITGLAKDSAELELAEALIPLRGAEFSDGFDYDPMPSCVLTTFDANNRIQQPRMVVLEAMARRVPIVNVAWLVASHSVGFLVDTEPFEAASDHRKSGPGVFEGLVATVDKAFDVVGVPAMVRKAGQDIRRLLCAGGALVVECGEVGGALQRESNIELHIHVINDFDCMEQDEVKGWSEGTEELKATQQNVRTKVVTIGWIGECLGMGVCPPPAQSCRLGSSSSWQSSVVDELVE